MYHGAQTARLAPLNQKPRSRLAQTKPFLIAVSTLPELEETRAKTLTFLVLSNMLHEFRATLIRQNGCKCYKKPLWTDIHFAAMRGSLFLCAHFCTQAFGILTPTTNKSNCYDALRRPIAFIFILFKRHFSQPLHIEFSAEFVQKFCYKISIFSWKT